MAHRNKEYLSHHRMDRVRLKEAGQEKACEGVRTGRRIRFERNPRTAEVFNRDTSRRCRPIA